MNDTKQLFKKLWDSAVALRGTNYPSDYKFVVLPLITLKYLSDKYNQRRHYLIEKARTDRGIDINDRDEYKSKNIFIVKNKANWNYLEENYLSDDIKELVDNAFEELEKQNPELKGIISELYSKKSNTSKKVISGLIKTFSEIDIVEDKGDLLGNIYEYFIGHFAQKEGQKGGEFYTPKSIVNLLINIIKPENGTIYDPACGSGGMFISSLNFLNEHHKDYKKISLYGQELNHTTWKLAKLNLILHNFDSDNIKWNEDGSFKNDEFENQKFDYILANPPFNQKKATWWDDKLANDIRWQYGQPPKGSANYGWIQHMIYHLKPNGKMGLVLSNGSLSSQSPKAEKEIREELIKNNLIDCIIELPNKLFYSVKVPACLWIISRKITKNKKQKTKNKKQNSVYWCN